MWKDTTSYSRGKERIPTIWTIKLGKLKLSVMNSHIYYPGEWVMTCEPFFITKELNVSTKEEAQAKALELIKEEVKNILDDLQEM